MNVTKSERPHISFFGCTNAGKSSLVNAITNQSLSVVSELRGTTTDPVQKAMEILPLGPVVIIDTAGLDDETELGKLRIEKTNQILAKTDVAILVVDVQLGFSQKDENLLTIFQEKKLPFIVTFNKSDLINEENKNSLIEQQKTFSIKSENSIFVSAKTNYGVNELREKIGHILQENKIEKFIIKDKLKAGDVIVLVIPIDESAPKGRVILPQQNVLREILDANAVAICVQPNELPEVLNKITPNLVITDSQAFNEIKDIVPDNIKLTSFSILMAKYKGNLEKLIQGAKTILELKAGDKVLISEGCTHHRQCNDIGTVKFPKWIKEFTNKNIEFEFTQGGEFPTDLSKYAMIIHCGGCMLNEKEMQNRVRTANICHVPMVNYGMAIAYMNGILERSLEIFTVKMN